MVNVGLIERVTALTFTAGSAKVVHNVIADGVAHKGELVQFILLLHSVIFVWSHPPIGAFR